MPQWHLCGEGEGLSGCAGGLRGTLEASTCVPSPGALSWVSPWAGGEVNARVESREEEVRGALGSQLDAESVKLRLSAGFSALLKAGMIMLAFMCFAPLFLLQI